MAQTKVTSQHRKISGSSEGLTGKVKHDGYASTSPHGSAIGSKPGRIPRTGQGYSGPDVARVGK